MSLAAIQKKGKIKPPRLVIYGPGGIGKTSFAAGMGKSIVRDSEGNVIANNVTYNQWVEGKQADDPKLAYPVDSTWSNSEGVIIVQSEDGIGKIECDHFPVAKSYEEFMNNLTSLLTEDHEFRVACIDSLDWLETLLWDHVCKENGWAQIDTPAYGKGYVAALDKWKEYVEVLNRLRDEKSMTVIQIAHNQIRRYEDPSNDPHDRHEIKLHRKAADLLVEHSDAVFFANYKVGTVQVKGKMGMTTKTVAGDRTIFTEQAPGYMAKNRYGLPSEMPFDWATIREEMLK